MNTLHRPAIVTKAKPAPCSGLLGKRCTCGLYHVADDERSLFASREFWLLGATCLVVWMTVFAVVYQVWM